MKTPSYVHWHCDKRLLHLRVGLRSVRPMLWGSIRPFGAAESANPHNGVLWDSA